MIHDAELFTASILIKKVKEGASPFLMRLQCDKRSAVRLVSRIIPLAKRVGIVKRTEICWTNYPTCEAMWDKAKRRQIGKSNYPIAKG